MAASICTISSSPPAWMSNRSLQTSRPSASLSLTTGSRKGNHLAVNVSATASSRPGLLHCSFLSPTLSFSSSFSGLSLDLGFSIGVRKEIGPRRGLVVRAGKAALCQTKRNRSRKSLSRTHGFRRRMRTTSGRAALKRRRAKGRKVLCTKSYPSSGKAS